MANGKLFFLPKGYLHIIRLIAIATSWCFSTKIRSSIAFGLIYFVIIMNSGNNLHQKNLNIVSQLVRDFSIYTHTYQSLLKWEFSNSNATRSMNQRFLCSNNPLVDHKNAIVAR